jgi:hypothetical protein
MRLEIFLLLAVLADLSLLVVALVLVMRPACRSKAFLLLTYTLTTGLNNDYVVSIQAIDRALGRDGALVHSITLPPAINFALDLSGRIALLIVIWLVLVYLMKETLAARAAR